MQNKAFLILALVAVVAFIPACGKKTIKTEGVTGVVTLNGQPLPYASLRFIPTDATGSESSGITDEKGAYKLQTLLGEANAGTTPGAYKVAIECYGEEETGKTHTDEDGNEVKETKEVSLLDRKYADPETSGLTAEVKSGKNEINFDLTE